MTRSKRKRSFHEAAHKGDVAVRTGADGNGRTGELPVQKRSFNEAAHKLGSVAAPDSSAPGRGVGGGSPAL